MEKKLILFDVDGTLYDNSARSIPASTISALKQLKIKGHELVVATGRSYFMLYSIEEIKSLFDHFILINGQHIIANKQVIYEDAVEKAKLAALISSMADMNITYGFQSAYSEAISNMNNDVKETFSELNLNLPPENKDFHEQEKVYQMWCFCKPAEMEILKVKNPDFDFVKWMSAGYDIIKKGQSKGKGINILKEFLGYKKVDIIAFGDGDNDVEMMETVGMGIAMGNGTEKVKNASKYITTDVDKDGIFNALKYLRLL